MGLMLIWISSDIDINFLVGMWEHDESKVPHIDGFNMWSTWNNKSFCKGIEGMTSYIKRNVSPHTCFHKIDPLN